MPRAPLVAAAALTVACSARDVSVVVRTVSSRTGAPVPGVLVQVEEQPWATTGADGKATFDAVPGPFTVLVHEPWTVPNQRSDSVFVLRGRTGREVVAEVGGPGPLQWHFARVSGTVTGCTGPPSTAVVRVGVAPFRDWSAWTVAAADASFDLEVPWHAPPGETAASVVLHAWESDGASPPGHYYGFGHSIGLSLVEGEVITGVPLTLDAVTEGTAEGAVSVPAALGPAGVLGRIWLAFGRYEQLALFSDFIPTGSFAWVLPSLGGAGAWIGVYTSGAWHERRIDVPSSGLVFDLPVQPELLAPAAGAAIGDATVFRWSPVAPGGRSTLYVNCGWTDPAGAYSVSYSVEAEGGEAILPAIPGLALARGAACDWAVEWCAATDPEVEERCSGSAFRAATW